MNPTSLTMILEDQGPMPCSLVTLLGEFWWSCFKVEVPGGSGLPP